MPDVVLLVAVPTGWLWLFHAWLENRLAGSPGKECHHQQAARHPSTRYPPSRVGARFPPTVPSLMVIRARRTADVARLCRVGPVVLAVAIQ